MNSELESNMHFLRHLDDLDGQIFGRDCYVSVGPTFIEFSCRGIDDHFTIHQKNFQKTVNEFIKKYGVRK